MAEVDVLDGVLERFKRAGQEFVKGNPKPVQELFSHRDDVTLANPFGPPARGWDEVREAQERGAAVFRAGEIWAFETVAKYATPELGCILWIERTNAKVGGGSGDHPVRPSGHDDPSARRWRVEGGPPPRGPHNLCAAGRVGDTEVDLPVRADFRELRYHEVRRIPLLRG